VTELTPILVLALAYDGEYRIILPQLVVAQRSYVDVQNREDQIIALEGCLAREKRFKFEAAILASDDSRRNYRNEENRLRDGVLDLVFPLRARCDRFLVLPEVDRPS
jgi:hypothetical protein